MKCQICQENEATIHLTEIENKQKIEVHLCEECARKNAQIFQVQIASSVAKTIQALVEKHSREMEEMRGTCCPACGISFADYQSAGRLGCPSDYEVFEKWLKPLIEKMHGRTEHVGKTPSGAVMTETSGEVIRLRKELDEAIEAEEYEKAAELRDRLKSLMSFRNDN